MKLSPLLPPDSPEFLVRFEPIHRASEMRQEVPFSLQKFACEGKATYASERAARAVARKRTERAGSRIAAYVCPFCAGWHIGGISRF